MRIVQSRGSGFLRFLCARRNARRVQIRQAHCGQFRQAHCGQVRRAHCGRARLIGTRGVCAAAACSYFVTAGRVQRAPRAKEVYPEPGRATRPRERVEEVSSRAVDAAVLSTVPLISCSTLSAQRRGAGRGETRVFREKNASKPICRRKWVRGEALRAIKSKIT